MWLHQKYFCEEITTKKGVYSQQVYWVPHVHLQEARQIFVFLFLIIKYGSVYYWILSKHYQGNIRLYTFLKHFFFTRILLQCSLTLLCHLLHIEVFCWLMFIFRVKIPVLQSSQHNWLFWEVTQQFNSDNLLI